MLIPLPGSARAQYQVGPASQDGLQHPGHCSRIIAAITVEEDHNIGLVCGQRTGQAGRTIAPLRLLNDGSPGGLCHRSGAVATAGIDDHHLVYEHPGDRPDNAPDSGLFIQGWNHY